jgi:hypothetical protein
VYFLLEGRQNQREVKQISELKLKGEQLNISFYHTHLVVRRIAIGVVVLCGVFRSKDFFVLVSNLQFHFLMFSMWLLLSQTVYGLSPSRYALRKRGT